MRIRDSLRKRKIGLPTKNMLVLSYFLFFSFCFMYFYDFNGFEGFGLASNRS